MVETADLLRIIATLVALTYASYLDIKTREIDSRIWRAMVALGVILIFFDAITFENPRVLIFAAFAIIISLIFTVPLNYLGLMGGGDAKLLIALATMFPFLPHSKFIIPLFFLSVFTNAIVIAVSIPLLFFIKNIKHLRDVRRFKEFFRLFVGYKKNAADVGEFETILKEGQVFIDVNKVELGKGSKGDGEVWVTPAIPFVVFLTAGFIISIVYGDLISLLF